MADTRNIVAAMRGFMQRQLGLKSADELKREIIRLREENLHEILLSETSSLIRLQDSKQANVFYVVEKVSLGAGRPVYNGRKVDPVSGALSEETYIIKYSKGMDSSEVEVAVRHEISAFRKLHHLDLTIIPHPSDPEDMQQIIQAMPWLGRPIQDYGEDEEKVKSPDHFVLSESVKEHDPIEIIKQILTELNKLHTENERDKAFSWNDPKGENIVLRIENGKPIISLIDTGDSRSVDSPLLYPDLSPAMTNWFYVKEKLENKQGILSDFPPLAALFAQLLGATDVLRDKRKKVYEAREKKRVKKF